MTAVLRAEEPSARYLVEVESTRVRGFESLATSKGGVSRLRELVLNLAVRGVLVPQISTEGLAATVLSSARAARTEDDIGRRARHSASQFGDDTEGGRFELPAGWLWVSGADLYKVVRGVSYEKQQASDVASAGAMPLLRANNIQRTLNFDDAVFVPSSLVAADQVLRAGDYVVCMASGSKGLVGKAAPFVDGPKFTFGAFCAAIRPYAMTLAPYLGVFLASPLYRDEVSAESAGIGINNLKSSTLLSLRMPLPPLAEQHRIVARVEELMKLCDALEQNGRLADEQHARLTSTLFDVLAASESAHALAENWQRVAEHFDLLLDRPGAIDALEQTILQLAVRGLLVPQEASDEPASELLERMAAYRRGPLVHRAKSELAAEVDEPACPFAVPAGWAWATWEAVALQIGDIDHKMPREVADGVPYISPKDFTEGNGIDFAGAKKITETDYEDLASKIKPERGDLIYPRYGTIGKVRLVETDLRFLASYSCAIIKCLKGYVDPEYQFIVSISALIVDQATAATNKTTQPNVGLKSIKSFLFPLPPLAEQQRIVARVEELRRLCADLRQRLTQAREAQSALADALVAEFA